jgi:hypothetical protein
VHLEGLIVARGNSLVECDLNDPAAEGSGGGPVEVS